MLIWKTVYASLTDTYIIDPAASASSAVGSGKVNPIFAAAVLYEKLALPAVVPA
jgi:hypothetical protein